MSAEQEKKERKRKRHSKDQPRDHPTKRSKKVKEEDQEAELVEEIVNGDVESTIVVPVVKKEKKKKNSRKVETQIPWSLSDPVGGWFLPQDPVFSPDEKFMILATRGYVQIYSTANSLLVRSLKVTPSEITSYAISKSEPLQIYAATSTGRITSWDLDTGKRLGRWEIRSDIRGIAAVTIAGKKKTQEIVFTQEAGDTNVLNAHTLKTDTQASETQLKSVLKTEDPIRSFQILAEGAIIVVAFQASLMVGKAQSLSSSLKKLTYVWHQFKVQKDIASFHARVKSQPGLTSAQQTDSLDLAIGCTDGAIYIYDEILRSLEKTEKAEGNAKVQSEKLLPRKLHWHRDAVASLKWSMDGNYLISGGKETVLVIWQLTTGKTEHLPHLTSEIESVVVSPAGTSYAVRLADNSMMVLSTSELNPKANIAGIQSRRVFQDANPLRPKTLASILEKSTNPLAAYDKIPMAINPLNSNQILLPIPSSQPRGETSDHKLPAPYLQTFDISTARHISRQALTRNNATNINLGPNRLKLREPDVKLMQVSHDGKWLATVEEWTPPLTDVDHIGESGQTAATQGSLRREIYLKFWQWDTKESVWMLEARIDGPHRFQDETISCQVFDLASHPTEVGFATIGEDSFVRVWKPRIRRRDGTIVRGAGAEALITWSNAYSVQLENSIEGTEANDSSKSSLLPLSACLAYSTDGSALAASQEWGLHTGPGLVHLINTQSGIIHQSIPELYTWKLAALAFTGRYLVVVSESVTVWDLVDDELSYSYPFDLYNPRYTRNGSMIHLAVNTYDSTFAVAFPNIHFERHSEKTLRPREVEAAGPRKIIKATSTIIIFDPSKPTPLHNYSLPTFAMALLPALNGSGYISLDSAAEIRIVSPKANSSIPLIGPIAKTDQSLTATEDIEEDMADMEINEEEEEVVMPEATEDSEMMEDFVEDTENDKPVVRSEHLAQLFDVGPSFAARSMKELFSSVVGLYARKPRVRWE